MEESTAPVALPLGNNVTRPKPKRLLLKWSLALTALALAYLTWQCGSGMYAAARSSDQAVATFHSELDSQAYEKIVEEADPAFQNSGSHEKLIKFLAGVHSKLGTSRSSIRQSIFVNATTNGTFIKVAYASAFEQGTASEVFTWRKSGEGLKLVGYNVNSDVFIIQ